MKALLTGANSLVNKSFLEKLVQLGYSVTAHYHSDNQLSRLIAKEFPEVELVQADFIDSQQVNDFIQQASVNKYDVVINAAVYYAEASTWQAQLEWGEWQKNFSVNTVVPGLMMANADKLMAKNGVIINVSSVFGAEHFGDIQFTMYGASKAALDLLTTTYAKRWQDRVRVVGVAAGWVESDWNKDMSADQKDQMLEDLLPDRLTAPGELADAMEFVINNKSVNATTINVDNGLRVSRL